MAVQPLHIQYDGDGLPYRVAKVVCDHCGHQWDAEVYVDPDTLADEDYDNFRCPECDEDGSEV